MANKSRCLVYLGDNFQDLEFVATLTHLKRSSLFELDFRGNLEVEREVSGQYGFAKVRVKPLKVSDLDSYDCLFVVGGAHCQGLRLDPLFKEVANYFFKEQLTVYAICDAPNVLYEFGLIGEEVAYTSYPIQSLRAGRSRRGEEAIVSALNSRLITARDPAAAFEFGIKILESKTKESTCACSC